jgi:DNA-directed RNA polymerase subunit M/transcription elongation factor TFIIS
MKFCPHCDNLLYVKTGNIDESRLELYCRSCGFVEDDDIDSNTCVLEDSRVDDRLLYERYVTKHLKHDPTLPRVNNIPCPNASCTRPESAEQSVTYVKYNVENMRYLYSCTHCGHFWRTAAR